MEHTDAIQKTIPGPTTRPALPGPWDWFALFQPRAPALDRTFEELVAAAPLKSDGA